MENQESKEIVQSLESFINLQQKLLELEREAEIQENRCLYESYYLKTLQEKGLCIPKLKIAHMFSGLFGKLVLKFVAKYEGTSIPSHAISSGDVIGICHVNSEGKLNVMVSGVVLYVHESYVTVALEKDCTSSELEDNDIYSLLKLANDVTYKRLKRVLKTLESRSNEIYLTSVLFGSETPSVFQFSQNDLTYYNQNLNATQKDAVCFALSQKQVAVLHGPPGTGKTTTLVECIMQCVTQKAKVLACAPSNIAVDNLIEKLIPYKIKMVRLGHPARASEEIHKFCLDSIISHYDGCDVLKEMQKELAQLKAKIGSTKGPKKMLWNENKTLLKEIKERQKNIVKQIINNADVVLSTLTSASEDGPLKYAEKEHFDICFIDECSQALEIACWMPLVLVKRCVIAGDHNQLPPTIISDKAAKQGLSLTLMERLIKLHGETSKKMLTIQYRMHHTIMQWPSLQLYDNKLLAHETVKNHLLKDLTHVESNEDTNVPLLLIDTEGCDLFELQSDDDESKGNEGEADLVYAHVESLLQSGLLASEIAVITPYNLQVELIKSRCRNKYPSLEIKSVDGFQGREKEAVVLSLVRSNESGEVGFLSEDRRINVAITRAKRSLTVVCNTRTVSHSPFLKSFILYCEEKGEIRSANQYAEKIGQYAITLKKPSLGLKENECRSKPKKKIIKKKAISSESHFSEQPNKCDDFEKISTDKKFRDIIIFFIKSNETSYSFSEDLSPFDRRVVHEISEELGLIHVSEGENPHRFIHICKKNQDENHLDEKTGSVLAPLNVKETILKHSIYEKTIPSNSNVKETISSSLNVKESIPANSNVKTTMPRIQDKDGTKKKKPLNLSSNKTSNKISKNNCSTEDFDSLILEVMKSDRTCCFNKCKKSVAILGQVCQFCKLKFCFSHFMPEVHGCGHLAKTYARSQVRKDGVLYAGSGRPEKKKDAIKQSYLQKTLNEKISCLADQRKTKPKK